MSKFVAQILTSSNALTSLHSQIKSANPTSDIYTFTTDKKNKRLTTVHLKDAPPFAPPIFTIHQPKDKQKVVIHHGEAPPTIQQPQDKSTIAPPLAIGAAEYHTFPDKIQIEYNGQKFQMKDRKLVEEHLIGYPDTPSVKWHHPDKLMGSLFVLKDKQKNKLARFRYGLTGKYLETLVPCEESFLGLVLLTGVVAYTSSHHDDDVLGEVAQVIIGL